MNFYILGQILCTNLKLAFKIKIKLMLQKENMWLPIKHSTYSVDTEQLLQIMIINWAASYTIYHLHLAKYSKQKQICKSFNNNTEEHRR